MNRRKFLSFFGPLAGVAAAISLPSTAAAATELRSDVPAGFVKLRCQVEAWPDAYGPGQHRPACGTEFLVPKGAGGYFYCPHCGSCQDTSKKGAREASLGILVKEGHPQWKVDWESQDRSRG